MLFMLQVLVLDLSGIGLVANLSEGRWGFLEDLAFVRTVVLEENPKVTGTFPGGLSPSIRQIAAPSTGAAFPPQIVSDKTNSV
jgi:hypothetical protein